MLDDDSPARPGLAPGTRRTAGPMFAALYGELVPHAWRAAEPEHDAYSLFHDRSLAMGWLDDSGFVVRGGGTEEHPVGTAGLWAMNDAGWGHPLAAAGSRLASWFQVEAQAVAAARPLPVQPFLRCAGDTTARAGTLHLEAVQVLLPVQGLDPASRPPYALVPATRTVHWFGERDPRSRTRLEVGLDSGRDPSIPAVAHRLTAHLGRLEQNLFACTSRHVGGPAGAPSPPFDDGFWNGPPGHGVTLRGELAEWSLDAIGWLGEVLADSAARLGVRSPVLLTVVRNSAEPGDRTGA